MSEYERWFVGQYRKVATRFAWTFGHQPARVYHWIRTGK